MFQSITTGLRQGVESQPMLDRRSMLIYSMMLAEAAVGAFASLATRFTYHLTLIVGLPGVMLIVCSLLLRRIGHARTADGIETTTLALVQGLPTIFIIFPLLAISAPLADSWLAQTDRTIGFDWLQFIALFKGHDQILAAVVAVYRSLFSQPFLILPALVVFGHSERAWATVTALSIALAVALLIYPFAPAVAAFAHFGVSPADFPLPSTVPWTTGPVVQAIKHGGRIVTDDSLKGLITFPSYHAAVAVIFAWAAWPVRWLRYPLAVLNAVMLVSCIIVGAHYLIDVIAGVAIGLSSVRAASKFVRVPSYGKGAK